MKTAWYKLALPLLIITVPLAVQLACGAGFQLPPRPVDILATRIAEPTSAQQVVVPPAIPEKRMLTLEFPPRIRAGDSDVVRLTLEVDESGNLTPTVSVDGNVIEGEVVEIPNLYETYNVLAEARLDLAGMDVRPADVVSETLLPGQKVTFYWSVLPAEVGHYKGTVWFYLHFVPKTNGQESRQVLSAQHVEIEATSFLGLRASPARWLGVSGAFISSLLGLPFLETVLKIIWKRLHG